MPSSSVLMKAEDAGWNELHALIDSLTPEEAERPGYYREGWSAGDMLAHIGSWLAAAGAVLERIRAGTYQAEEVDVDAWNERFLQAMKGVPFLERQGAGVRVEGEDAPGLERARRAHGGRGLLDPQGGRRPLLGASPTAPRLGRGAPHGQELVGIDSGLDSDRAGAV